MRTYVSSFHIERIDVIGKATSLWIGIVLSVVATLAAGTQPAVQTQGSIPLPRIEAVKLEFADRYVYADLSRGDVTDREVEYRMSDILRLHLDRKQNSWIEVRGESGNGFNNSWSEAGVGMTHGSLIYNIKSLSLAQRFGGNLQAEAGGIEFERGAGTELTYAAGEAWLTGYCLRLVDVPRLPRQLIATAGYIGDFDRPNFFSRGSRMGQVNYFQFLGQQPLSANSNASLEVDSLHGMGFVRGALKADNLPGRVIDGVIVESIGRFSGSGITGWSISMNRAFDRDRFKLDAHYSDIPQTLFRKSGQFMLLNGGEVGFGQRAAVNPSIKLGRSAFLEVLCSRRLDNSLTTPRWRGFVALHCDGAALFNKLAHI
jgi:hypothetical protein